MKTFATKPGVNKVETVGPDGALLSISSDAPLQTDDPVLISIIARPSPIVEPEPTACDAARSSLDRFVPAVTELTPGGGASPG